MLAIGPWAAKKHCTAADAELEEAREVEPSCGWVELLLLQVRCYSIANASYSTLIHSSLKIMNRTVMVNRDRG